jgi:small subunit ribosomal protein S7
MRRRAAPKRKILPDPKFGDEILAKFINHLMLDGKKSLSESVIYGALDILTKKVKVGRDEEDEGGEGGARELVLFKTVLRNVAPTVEVKSRRVGGSTYQIPIEVTPARGRVLAMRWLIDAARARRSEKSMKDRLAAEMADAFNGRGSAVKKREDTHRMAKANQAFAHYRW